MESKEIVARIERELQMPGLFEALAERLPASELTSLLLAVFRARAAKVSVKDVLARAESRLARPSAVDSRQLLEVLRTAYSVAGGFEAVELSPVVPFGTVHALGRIDQNNVLTASRNVEVLADPTEAWALICASRRRKADARAVPVRMCGAPRLMRLQPVDNPAYSAHFSIFALVTAGRDTGNQQFETDSMYEHLAFHLGFIDALGALGYEFRDIVIDISDTEATSALLAKHGVDIEAVRGTARAHRIGAAQKLLGELKLPEDVADPQAELASLTLARAKERIKDRLATERPEVRVRINAARLEGLGYYAGLCMRITATDPSGAAIPLADGGFTTWTQSLLADQKERFLGTGIGTEVICKRYRADRSVG